MTTSSQQQPCPLFSLPKDMMKEDKSEVTLASKRRQSGQSLVSSLSFDTDTALLVSDSEPGLSEKIGAGVDLATRLDKATERPEKHQQQQQQVDSADMVHTHHQQLLSGEDVSAVQVFFVRASFAGSVMWLALLLLVFLVAPADSYQHLEGIEQRGAWTLAILLFTSSASRITNLAIQGNGFFFLKSGVIIGSFTVQFIALVANMAMAIFPTPVMIDPMTGMRIHLVRFATWIPLAFLMTFLTEAIDLNCQSRASGQQSFKHHSYQVALWHASTMALSTAAGGIFPFCTNKFAWWTVMLISWVLFATIYVRLYQRYTRYQQLLQKKSQQQQLLLPPKSVTKQEDRSSRRGPNFLLNEAVDRARMSFQLILLCTITWTAIAATFTICCFLPHYAPKNSAWVNPELPLVIGFMLEAVSKIWYLSLQLHVYEKVFDESTRAVRRLEEMRKLVSALWVASSDILVMCTETDNSIHAIISPHPLLKDFDDPDTTISTMLEISKLDGTFNCFPMNLSEPVTRGDAERIQRMRQASKETLEAPTTKRKNLATLANLSRRACCDEGWWKKASTAWSLQELLRYFPETRYEMHVKCEAKVSPIDSGGFLLVLRDVSERYQRFEVEKQLLEEVIVRKKDAETIRFTRHEVKNGLLSAIGMVDHMKEHQPELSSALPDQDANIDDLDSTLKEILDAILNNAMIREVVYEGYVPRRESVNLADLLCPKQRKRSSCGGANSITHPTRMFPLFVAPEPFPHLLLDPQLIRKIYQNAVSNACKYGKKDGNIKTFLTYDSERQIFRMEVVNLAGFGHDNLLKLNPEEVDGVFQERTQLQVNQCLDTTEGKLVSARSAGDGALIMQKCAQCLGGACEIEFSSSGTTLSLECPASVSKEWRNQQLSLSPHGTDHFALPSSTWAIVVEDSPMQQKLLGRFLLKAGISDDRCIILGKTAEEIYAFTDTIRDYLKAHPNDLFLLIVDENLDIADDPSGSVTSTISGSCSVQKLRQSLDAKDERRVLALIRSANDSVKEVEFYKEAGHGFLLKGPMKKGGLLEEIKPWWIRRFGEIQQTESQRSHCKGIVSSESDSNSGIHNLHNAENVFGLAKGRIMDLVKGIDSMCGYRPLTSNVSSSSSTGDGVGSSLFVMDWQPIRYKLLLLNVDLKIHSSRDHLALASSAVDDLTSNNSTDCIPKHLLYQWTEIRELIIQGAKNEI